MLAIICSEFGPVSDLKFMEVDTPEPGPGEVRIAVAAAGVNFPDALLVQGKYQVRPPRPFIPGAEFAGTVELVGDGVKRVNPGDRVLAFSLQMGGFAEQAVLSANQLIPLPDSVPFVDAANLLCAHGTAHHGLKQRAKLQPDENLVVLGAAGGTGLGAVQIGKAMGARVIAVCSTEEKLETARQSGADVLINASESDLKAAINDATDGKGADVVYDVVGGDAFTACSRAMARNGRLLIVGFASGDIPQFPVNLALVKEYAVIGVFWGSWATHEPAAFAENVAELFAWYDQGKVSVETDTEYKLADTATALERMLQRNVKGKLVITT
jgi:NADPH:quinone reductase